MDNKLEEKLRNKQANKMAFPTFMADVFLPIGYCIGKLLLMDLMLDVGLDRILNVDKIAEINSTSLEIYGFASYLGEVIRSARNVYREVPIEGELYKTNYGFLPLEIEMIYRLYKKIKN